MKNKFYCGCLSLMLCFLSCDRHPDKYLFVKGEKDWLSSGESEWSFQDGELLGYASENSGFVMTEDRFEDFILELEFYPDNTVNSGVFARCRDITLSATDCYEFNIWDEHPDQDSRTGAVVSRSSPLNKVHTLNQWNTYKIKCIKDHIQAWVNGIKVIDISDKDLVEGHIGLQVASNGTIRFRNVHMEILKP